MKKYISFYDEGHCAFVGTIREIKTLLNNLWKRKVTLTTKSKDGTDIVLTCDEK